MKTKSFISSLIISLFIFSSCEEDDGLGRVLIYELQSIQLDQYHITIEAESIDKELGYRKTISPDGFCKRTSISNNGKKAIYNLDNDVPWDYVYTASLSGYTYEEVLDSAYSGACFSADASKIYYTIYDENQMYKLREYSISSKKDKNLNATLSEKYVNLVRCSQDGKWLAFDRSVKNNANARELCLYSIANETLTVIDTVFHGIYSYYFSANNSKIYGMKDNSLFSTIDLATSKKTLTQVDGSNGIIKKSGNQIYTAFTSYPVCWLKFLNAEGSETLVELSNEAWVLFDNRNPELLFYYPTNANTISRKNMKTGEDKGICAGTERFAIQP